MSGLAFVTHPSVRIRGSENIYTPVQCLDEQCFIKTAHLHCPFCVKTDSYTDPVILKAHYRVKHVDKGIEFAGLKILRCCDHCDIVGVIKGEKKFKGAHWHCYRCRNGFNRRDEAIKHYKTHFRNPQTTFQISITQDLNNPVAYNTESKSAPQTPVSTSASNPVSTNSIHPALTEAISSVSSPGVVSEQDVTSSNVPLCNGKVGSGGQTAEVVEDDEQQQAIVIIEEGQLRSSDLDTFTAHVIDIENVNTAEKKSSEKKIADDRARLEKRLRQVTEEKDVLISEVARLHRNVTKLEESLRQSRKREMELVARLGNATERSTTELLKRLEQEHRNLLRQHLDTLHNYVLTAQSPTTSAVLQLTDQHGQEIQVVNASSLEAFFAGNITSSSEVRTSLPAAIIQGNDLSLEEVVASEAAEVVESADVPVSVSDVDLTTNYVMCIQNLKTEKENEDDEEELSPKVTFSTTAVVLPSQSPARKKRKVN